MVYAKMALVAVSLVAVHVSLGGAFRASITGDASSQELSRLPKASSHSAAALYGLGKTVAKARANVDVARAALRPVTQADISTAIAEPNALRANRAITMLHYDQGRQLSALMDGEANFHTWAAHASNEVRSSMEMFIGDTWGTRWLRPALWLFADREEIIRAFTAGNRQVPGEVNRVTAEFVDWVQAKDNASFDDFRRIARARHGEITNFDLVLDAFADYDKAIQASNSALRAQHALAGNLRLVTAEQLALQPELSRIYDAFGNGALHRFLRALRLDSASEALREAVIHAYGKTGKIRYGDLEFRLQQPLPSFDATQVYPPVARVLSPSGTAISKRLSLPESMDELAAGGVSDWFSGPDQRLKFIGTLFRQQHNADALFVVPRVHAR